MKKTLWMVLGLLVISSMILVACGSPAPAPAAPAAEKAPPPPEPTPVEETEVPLIEVPAVPTEGVIEITKEQWLSLTRELNEGTTMLCGFEGGSTMFTEFHANKNTLHVISTMLLNDQQINAGYYMTHEEFDQEIELSCPPQ